MFSKVIRGLCLIVLAFGVVTVAGCGDDDSASSDAKSATTQPAAAAEPAALAVSAEPAGGKAATYELPASVKAGLTTITFTNNTTGVREAGFVRVEGGHTLNEVQKVINDQNGGEIPAWLHAEGGVSAVKPGGSSVSTQVLKPGEYYVIDSTDPDSDVTPAKPSNFTITGPAVDAALPPAPAQVTADEYGYTFAGLKAGKNTVRFTNAGKELHHALFFKEAAGATRAQVLEFFNSQGEGAGKPPVDFSDSSGTTLLDRDGAQNTELNLTPGKYAVVCFLTDRAGGPPHIAKGMFAEVTIK